MSPLGKRRPLGLGLALLITQASAAPGLSSSFGSNQAEAAAFVVAGGREVVTLGVAGKDLQQARLLGATAAMDGSVVDPVSRLVVFRARGNLGSGLPLAAVAPAGGVLKDAGGRGNYQIRDRVERVGGRYLPFTLLRLTTNGPPPRPGTPLLDAGGRVVALAHQPAGKGLFYALPVEVVRRVLDDSRDGRVSKAWIGLVLNPESGSTKVERVVAGSPAAEAGLRAGDVLTEIGGRRLADYGDAVNAFFLLQPERAVRVKVRRGSAEVMLELVPRSAES
ncbi:S1C family serine protease [Haloferula sp. A504]|uniref:S1C family serine protease n=1 Tax=Haloferula sp. A504 TaxID=3373601 RepID=UPI0031BEC916|nr:S1C family serine protease [Verrucomicrobiaceae bacterium E54]